MKKIFTLILLLLPLLAMSQSRKSDRLYAQGMELLDAGKFEEALTCFQKSDSLDKKKLKPTHENYYRAELAMADCYQGLAGYNDEIGNLSEAIIMENLTVEIRKKVLGDNDPKYAEAIGNLAYYYFCIGKDDEAIKLGTEAAEIIKNTLGEEHPYYANALNNLAAFNSNIENYAEAIRLGTIAMELNEKYLGEEDPQYALSVLNLANYYSTFGNHVESIRLGNIAMQLLKDLLGEEDPYYATSLNNLAVEYDFVGDYKEAIRLGNIAMEIQKKVLGEQHSDYLLSLINLADYYFHDGNYDESSKLYRKIFDRTKSYILKNFFTMTLEERSYYWNGIIAGKMIRNDLPFDAYKHPDTSMTSLAYDSQILAKGLLLNAELEIQKLIEQSGDTVFANRYYKLKQDRATLDDLYQTSPEEREMDADSLAKVIEKEERLLVASTKELGDYTKNLSVSWRDVQKNLKDNDLAIEFVNVPDTTIKQQVYYALVLKKGMAAPEFVNLFSSDDFYAIKSNEYYTTPKLFNLVWQPLAEYLKDAKSVYFSPAGRIHTIGIEYLSGDDGKIFAEKFDTYRLSSTRELAINHTINPNRKATTYGGIQYEFTPDEWRSLQDVNDSIERSFRDIPQIADNMRGGASGMSYLDGTKLESAAIANLLRSVNYDVNALSDAAATEESFKMLSGSGIQILHIGTHGFYESEGDMENAGYKFYTAASQQTDEDKALSCSGLLFAGANSALNPKRVNEIPEGADDGILTAKEISRLNFSGLDLVVLSACQTGLGEVTGEGVFGLQRGFKKAGAQTIVMSLWKVADEPTQLLMVEFFKNLTAGQSKRAAFLAAQQTVRAKYPNPLYWAAFVMVDGN
ncbi:MAG: CHAT domain-containing protein [Bacteroidales bacterium]|nr:CHAT domain-containing protein [Bacteroidales bacterium]